jgi:hypothetical protein
VNHPFEKEVEVLNTTLHREDVITRIKEPIEAVLPKILKKATDKAAEISEKVPGAASAVLHRKRSRSQKIMMGATKSAQVLGFITAAVLSLRLIARRMRNGG